MTQGDQELNQTIQEKLADLIMVFIVPKSTGSQAADMQAHKNNPDGFFLGWCHEEIKNLSRVP